MAKPQEAIRWRLIEKILVDWVEFATKLPRDSIMWGMQNADQAVYPFAVLNVIAGPTRIGMDDAQVDTTDLTRVGAEVRTQYQGPRLFTVSLNILVGKGENDDNSNPDCNALALMSAAEADLRTITRRDAFNPFGLALVRTNPVVNLSEVLNGEWVDRRAMDVEISTQSVIVEDFGFVENISGTATIQQPGLPDILEPFATDN